MKQDNRLLLEKLRYNLFACPPFASMIGVLYMIKSKYTAICTFRKSTVNVFLPDLSKNGCIYGMLNFSRINDKILKPSAKVHLTY